ncbi:MAG: D-tyrosyl-tRNA(Tyr) deacylase [Proteobacteria bacterium]|nr:D-tyrosyl-tRNA(Tyr) deacylase [Pseudomonadota bacterium]
MIALLQRVTEASVIINGDSVAAIGQGLLVLVGVEKNDTEKQLQRLAERLLSYRVFADADEKMNLDVRQVNGELILVPQFTLAANTNKGKRPSFSSAAPPALGKQLFEQFVEEVSRSYNKVQCGVFGADMQVSLVNDGPVTFWLQVD